VDESDSQWESLASEWPRASHSVETGLQGSDENGFLNFDFSAVASCAKNFYAKGVVYFSVREV